MNQSSRKNRSAVRKGKALERADDYQKLDFQKKNWVLFSMGLLTIVGGFAMLSTGDITLAPILLVGGYLVLIPWAILTRTPGETVGDMVNGGE